MEQVSIADQYMTQVEAASYLGFSPITLQQWRWSGKGPVYIKLGGKIRYAKEDLDRFAKSGRVVPEFSKAG